MIKTANLILKSITYAGDSICDTMRIEVEAANNIISFDKRIRNGSSVQCDKNIAEFITDGNSLTIPLTIRIIEKDLLFNDVGSIKENIKINFNTKKPQQIVYQVDVRESRGVPIRRTASFHCIFEIPDHSHEGGHRYPETKLSTVWFRVGHSGDRYIHTGKHSLGCITLIEQKKWDAFCAVLMKARKGDGRSIGTLEVID